MSGPAKTEYARHLGAEIRSRRLARGMSLRGLAKELGLSAHGTLVDYEHGRRIPPEDLVAGCERVFRISDGALRDLREKALAERADQQANLLLNRQQHTVSPMPRPESEERSKPVGWSRWQVVALVAVVVAVGIGVGIWRLTTSPAVAAPRVQAARTVVANWGVCWGGQVAGVQPTNAVTYSGARSLQITVRKPNSAGDFAVCTIHGLETLHPGMKVTVHLRVPSPEPGGVAFFVYDSKSGATWAPQTPEGDHTPLPTRTDWQTYVWTVPKVDKVHAIGMEVYSTTDQPLIVWLGGVSW